MNLSQRTPLAAALFALLAAACAPPQSTAEERVGTVSAPIQTEVAGEVEVISRMYLSADPAVIRTSFSAPLATVAGTFYCSATMISPHVAMTAGHCQQPIDAVAFATYTTTDPTSGIRVSYPCTPVVRIWRPNQDVQLLFCKEGHPGDRYGYVDFSRTAPSVGTPVYSHWTNPVKTLGTGSYSLYSDVTVGSFTGNGGVNTNLWVDHGGSGSSQIDVQSHRITIGPTSVGTEDGVGRGANTLQAVLTGVVAESGDLPHPEVLTDLGLDPNRYLGHLDQNNDGLIDLVVDLERSVSGARQDFRSLAFDSEIKNARWSGASIDAANAQLHVVRAAPPFGRSSIFLSRSGLNLVTGAKYRITLRSYAQSAGSSTAAFVGFYNPKSGAFDSAASLSTVSTPTWSRQTVELVAPSGDAVLAFAQSAAVDLYLDQITMVRDGGAMDFDSADARSLWINERTGGEARMLPMGSSFNVANEWTSMSWAAEVIRTPQVPQGNDWSLSTRALAIPKNRAQRVCFEARQLGFVPAGDYGLAWVTSGGAEVVRFAFRPTNGWGQRICSPVFTTSSDDAAVMFGVNTPTATVKTATQSQAEYIIDNLFLASP